MALISQKLDVRMFGGLWYGIENPCVLGSIPRGATTYYLKYRLL